MLPENLYKRRRNHNNTPPLVLLILTNCIVFALLIQFFAACDKVNNFFWAALAVLAFYNLYTIRRNPDEHNRLNIIIYSVSIVGMIVTFYFMSKQPHNC
jgi:threonine/homoserine efflux transporter RhtA